MKTAEARLWRFLPPFTRTVTLRQISVQGFMDMVRGWILTGGPLGLEHFIARAVPFTADMTDRQFARWSTRRNAERVVTAATTIHNWPRLYGCLNLTGKPRKGAGIWDDVISMAQMWAVSPEVILQWPMEHFLNVTDSLVMKAERAMRSEDPTLDPDADPMPLQRVGLQGLEVIH
jgi:hypothetical protein